MLMPKRVKFRRPHRVYYHGHAKGGTDFAFGEFVLVCTEGCWLTSNQIEAARIAITRKMNRQGQVWIKVFPHVSKTKKPLAVRMGSGKGAPEVWVAVAKKDVILFEVAGVPEDIAREALRLASHKLPCTTKIVKRVGE